jgi:hypothetical protein
MNIPNIVEKVYAATKASIQNYPCRGCRASSIGDPCERRLCYEITSWEQKPSTEVGLERIFREGAIQERAVLAELLSAGIDVIEQQQSFRVENITGHVDGAISVRNNGESMSVPLEIKSMASHIWESIFRRGPGVYDWVEVVEGFQKKVWLRRYYAQLQVYALGKNAECAILLCKNKGTGALAQVNVHLDLVYAEELLQRAKRVEQHVAAGTMPDRIPFDPEVCGKCDFEALCMPDVVGREIAFIAEDIVLDLLRRREANALASEEYDHCDKTVKDFARARPEESIVVSGEWSLEKRKSGKNVRVNISRVAK